MIFSLPLAMIIIGGTVGIWSSIQDQEARKHKEECHHSQVEKPKQIETSDQDPEFLRAGENADTQKKPHTTSTSVFPSK